MTGFEREFRNRRIPAFLMLAALVSAASVTTGAAQDQASDTPAPAAAQPAEDSRLPVQELEDPIRYFRPKTAETRDDHLKGEALAWFMTAQLHYSRGENAEGLAALKKTIEKDSTSLTPYRALVPALLDARDLEGARKFALQAGGVSPDGVVLIQGVALTLARIGKVEEAIALVTDALPLAPKDSQFGRYLSLIRMLGTFHRAAGRDDKAAEQYLLVLEALKSDRNKLTAEQQKELLGEPGVMYDEFGQAFLNARQPELALRAFDEASKFRPARPGIHSFNLAKLFRQTNKPNEALAELEKYYGAQLQIKGMEAYSLLADILKELKKEDELLPRLEKLQQADPQNAPLAFYLAGLYVEKGRYDDALKTYKATPGGTRDPRAMVGLIGIYRHKKDYAELLPLYTRAYQLLMPAGLNPAVDPETAELSSRFLAETEALQNNDEVMKGLIDYAHSLQRQDPPKLEFFPAYVLGRLCIDSDRSEDAIDFYRYAISMQNSPPAQLYVDIALHLIQTDKFKPAVEILKEAIQHPTLDDERPFFIQLQCAALEMDGQTDQALAVIRQAKQDYPRELRIHEREAWIYYHAQQWEKAITAYEALIAAAPSLNGTEEFINTCRFSLSAIYVHIENFDKGEKILEDILAKEPENTQANNDLGYLWADRGKNLDRAKIMIEKALAAEPENAAYLDSMGWVLFRLGKFEEARENLQKATKDPRRQDATIWDHLGDVQDKLGNREEAIKSWVKALEIEFGKPKQDDKLVKALLAKTPSDRVPPRGAKPDEKTGKAK